MAHNIFNLKNYFFNPAGILYYSVGILTLLEGIYIFIQNRKAIVNFAYLVSCFFVALWLTGMGFVFCSYNETIAIIWTKCYVFLGIIFITPSIYFFSVSWQWKEFSEDKNKKKIIIIANFITAFIFYLLVVYSDILIQGMWEYSWGFYPKAGKAYFVLLIWFFTLMTLLLLNFIAVYRKEKILIKKKQAKLMIIAFSIAYTGSYEFLINYGFSIYLLAFIPVFICISIVGYSVIRYKLLDIETAVHKTIGWLFTTITLISPFVVLLYFTKSWFIGFNPINTFIYFGILSLLFLFFVRTFQPKIDQIFQRRRYNLEEISARFIDEVIHLKEIDQLIQCLQNTINNTLYPQYVDVFLYNINEKNFIFSGSINSQKDVIFKEDNKFLQWLAKNDKIVYKEFAEIDPIYISIKEEVKDYFNLTKSIVVIPLVLNEKLLGIINLGKKANLKRYSAIDFYFLNSLRKQSTIAISNSLLYQNIEEEVRDRTNELVKVQKQLVQAEKLATLGTLAGGVAHEINNPLTAILTNVQMLLNYSLIADEEDKESLELIEEATKRCKGIVQKLMLYGRKQDSSSTFSRVDLANVIKNAVSLLSYQFSQENVTITTDFREGNFWVKGNQNELEQVITNILLNAKDAIKQIKNNGIINVTILKNDELIRIMIKDEGAGISKEVLSKIFDPFFTTKEVGKGTGLGLSISQAIIEKHNGVIMVESEPNKGAIFTIQLPVEWENSLKK